MCVFMTTTLSGKEEETKERTRRRTPGDRIAETRRQFIRRGGTYEMKIVSIEAKKER